MAHYYIRSSRYWVTYQKDGQRVRRPLRTVEGRPVKDEKVAKYLTNELENQIERGDSPIPDSNISPQAVFDEYNEYAKGFKSEATIRTDKSLIGVFLKTTKPNRIGQITNEFVKSYLDSRISDKKISHVSANDTIKTLKTFINFAIKRNYLSRNLIKDLPKYRVNVVPPLFLRDNETAAIIEASKTEILYSPIVVALYTGMRLGELKRLRWEHINQKNKIITIMQSKSGRFREIPIHPDLITFELPFNFTNHQKVFKRICRRAYRLLYKEDGCLNIGWHTFRHTFASNLLMNGVSLVALSELLGHMDIATTMIYAHLTKDHLRDSIGKLKIVPNPVPEIVSHETSGKSYILCNTPIRNIGNVGDNAGKN